MVEVETVGGPVDVGSVGQVQVHGHLFTLGTEMTQNYPDPWDEDHRVADAAAELRTVGSTIVPIPEAAHFQQRRLALLSKWTLVHISDGVLPALRERGVTDEQITTMLVDNPHCYFTGSRA